MSVSFNKTRIRNGVREARFGGYAVWWSRGRRIEREVRAWGPTNVDDTDCGPGTAAVVRLLTAKIDPDGKRGAVIRESWRY